MMLNFQKLSQLTKRTDNLVTGQATMFGYDVATVYREPYILSGYRRPGYSWTYYVYSIFHRHNETFNIWTHLIATILLLQKTITVIFTYTQNTVCETTPLIAFGLCAITNFVSSALAHTFHSRSPFCHYMCYQLDYAGVGLNILGQSLLFLATSCPNKVYASVGQVCVPVYVFLAWFVIAGGCASKLLFNRPYPFKRRVLQLISGGLLCVFGSVPVISRFVYCVEDAECRIISLSHHILWIISINVAIIAFCSHWPEKLFPGRFDYIGHSHQIFHMFQSCTVLLQLRAAHIDTVNKQQSLWSCHYISTEQIFYSISVYIIGSILIIVILTPFVNQKILNDEKHD